MSKSSQRGPLPIVLVAVIVVLVIVILALVVRYELFSGIASDDLSPSAVTDLTTQNPTGGSIELRWTAPGDDGSTGQAAEYDIRYSTQSIESEAQWNQAQHCFYEPAPETAGTIQTFVVMNLTQTTTYHFAMKTADEVPNWSPLSNSPNGTTTWIHPFGITIEKSGDGTKWVIIFTSVPPGMTMSGTFLTIFKPDGTTNLTTTPFDSLNFQSHGVTYSGDFDIYVEVAERLLLMTTWYGTGSKIQISTSYSILVSSTLM